MSDEVALSQQKLAGTDPMVQQPAVIQYERSYPTSPGGQIVPSSQQSNPTNPEGQSHQIHYPVSPGGQNGQTVLYVNQPPHLIGVVSAGGPFMSPVPTRMICPYCGHDIVTNIVRSPSTCAWYTCIALFLFGCWFGCCLIPFCVDSFQRTTHSCPNCGRIVGFYGGDTF